MGLFIEDATEVKEKEAAQAIYVSKEAHDNIDKVIAIMEAAGKQISGVKNTKRALFEYSSKVLLDMVETSPMFKAPAAAESKDK